MGEPAHVELLAPGDAAEVISVLGESFADYPVMRFVLGSEGDYASGLETLVRLFVMARVFADDRILGVRGPDGLAAAALVSSSMSKAPGPELGVDASQPTLGGLATSIIAPSHRVAERYRDPARGDSSPMPTLASTMTVQQLADLVAYLERQGMKTQSKIGQ